jgi:hypothetical protein
MKKFANMLVSADRKRFLNTGFVGWEFDRNAESWRWKVTGRPLLILNMLRRRLRRLRKKPGKKLESPAGLSLSRQ